MLRAGLVVASFSAVTACRSALRPEPRATRERAPDAATRTLLDASTAPDLSASEPDAAVPEARGASIQAFDAPPPRAFEAVGVAPPAGPCRGVRALPLAAPVDVLDGRFRLRLPPRFERSVPVQYALSDTRRVRLALPLGRATMYLDVEDRFRRDDGTLREALDRFTFGRLPARAWMTPRGLRAIAILPRPRRGR